YLSNGMPQRLPPEVAQFDAAMRDVVPIDNRDADDVLQGNLAILGAAKKDAPIDFLVWGDSHARTTQPALELICRELGLNGRSATHSATTPLLGFYQPSKFGLNEEAVAFGQAIFDYVKAHKIPKVFLICRWQSSESGDDSFDQAFIRTVKAFRDIGVRVYVMMQVPSHQIDVPKKLAYNALLQQTDEDWRTTTEQHRQLHAGLYRLAQSLKPEDCVFIDPAPAFLQPASNRYVVIDQGESLYSDQHHLTGRAAKRKLYAVLKPAFLH
ncbi:MAG TPA: SGNH hydrolase domain-containing protein, partial [Lacunisphaera sp.]|nr:SGNH hydrolase domain-containing protein [Lacunisphaera sp.]